MFKRQDPPANFKLEPIHKLKEPYSGKGFHNLQRKACLTQASAVNHKKDVYFVENKDFDLNSTIFASVSGLFGLRRMIMNAKLANELMWSQEKEEKIEKEFDSFEQSKMMLVKEPKWNEYGDILEFMQTDCNFNAEHADGSFMDHLYFCRDYSAAYYKAQSPRILFLHSILGVGSNVFPMKVEKEDKLKDLVTPAEFKQIEVFPSILRLMYHKRFIDELMNATLDGTLDTLESVKMHRVIDNKEVVLTREELWIAMNMQMIHQLDFLPCSNWCSEVRDPMFQVFVEMHELLTKSKKLEANVNMNEVRNLSEKDEFGMPISLGTLVSKASPKKIKRDQIAKSVEGYSKTIGHDLSYEIVWNK